MKFKVPDFEKDKGNTCPLSHLVMYPRKMSTQTDNDQFLIHYFQDSLTGAALRWYMGLDSASVRTFNDLGEAFIKQYKYNIHIVLILLDKSLSQVVESVNACTVQPHITTKHSTGQTVLEIVD